jgi:CheY-like chemotaxis protein
MPDIDGFGLAERVKQRPELATTMIMMLSSVGHRGDTAGFRELGVASYLTKPVRQSILLDAILGVLRGSSTAVDHKVPLTRDIVSEAHRSLHVLLAEDNAVNRQLVKALLAKRGHSVVTVGNGREAIAALADGTIDLVLMDVQMPEMDGLEATAVIRTLEKVTGAHVPIIALTAHRGAHRRQNALPTRPDSYRAYRRRSLRKFRPACQREQCRTATQTIGGDSIDLEVDFKVRYRVLWATLGLLHLDSAHDRSLVRVEIVRAPIVSEA